MKDVCFIFYALRCDRAALRSALLLCFINKVLWYERFCPHCHIVHHNFGMHQLIAVRNGPQRLRLQVFFAAHNLFFFSECFVLFGSPRCSDVRGLTSHAWKSCHNSVHLSPLQINISEITLVPVAALESRWLAQMVMNTFTLISCKTSSDFNWLLPPESSSESVRPHRTELSP